MLSNLADMWEVCTKAAEFAWNHSDVVWSFMKIGLDNMMNMMR